MTSQGKTPHDYFIRLANAFLDGKYYITESPPWLNELIPASSNKFYIPYPPMPAILITPFVKIFKYIFEQQYLAHILGAVSVFFTYKLSLTIKNDKKLAIWSAILIGFGTIIWFLSSVGSAWYLAHICSFCFLIVALEEGFDKKRPFLTGIFLGISYLSRLPTILSIPVFIYLLKRKKTNNIFMFFLGIIPFILLNFVYNFLRFETIFDKGYMLIPGVLEEIWYKKGIFSLTYIPRHLKIIFASFPIFQRNFPFVIPSWAGLSIWITTPAFFYSLFANIKERFVQICWITIIIISLVIFSHGTTGFIQFGYRFAVDFYPFLLILTIMGVAKGKLKTHHWIFLIISVLVNFWGVIFINKFSWVKF